MPSLISLFALAGLTCLAAAEPPAQGQCPPFYPSNSEGRCTVTARDPSTFKKSPNLICGKEGELKKASVAHLMGNPCYATDFNSCRDYCLAEDSCHTFSYDVATTVCSLYNKQLTHQSYKDKTSDTGVQHYNRHCFKVSCPRVPVLSCGGGLFGHASDIFQLTSNSGDNLAIQPDTNFGGLVDVALFGDQSSGFYLDCLCRLTAVNGGDPLYATTTVGITDLGAVEFLPVIGDVFCSIDPYGNSLNCGNVVVNVDFYEGGQDTLGNYYNNALASSPFTIDEDETFLTASNFLPNNNPACIIPT